MKRIATLLVSATLALGGCIHSPQTRAHAATAAVTAAVIAGIVLATVAIPCAQCSDVSIGPKDGAR